MTSTKFSPLRAEAPRLVADATLGEHLAALARASAPSGTSRVRRSGWRVPLAAVATIAASSSVAYASQAALESRTPTSAPVAVNTAGQAASAAADAASAALAAVPSGFNPINPQGKPVGHGHPKRGKAKGHPGKHDAGKHRAKNPNKTSASLPPFGFSLWRKSAGSAGVSSP